MSGKAAARLKTKNLMMALEYDLARMSATGPTTDWQHIGDQRSKTAAPDRSKLTDTPISDPGYADYGSVAGRRTSRRD